MENCVRNEIQSFEYTYSAKEQQEIEKIRKRYLPEEENKLETLKKLDRDAEKPGTIISIVVGVIGSLIMGMGMCCTMVWTDTVFVFVLGIIIGIIGMAILAAAYPLYRAITKRERAKIAEKIIQLSEELSL